MSMAGRWPAVRIFVNFYYVLISIILFWQHAKVCFNHDWFDKIDSKHKFQVDYAATAVAIAVIYRFSSLAHPISRGVRPAMGIAAPCRTLGKIHGLSIILFVKVGAPII